MKVRIVLLVLLVTLHSQSAVVACSRCGRSVCRFVTPARPTVAVPSAPVPQVVAPPQPSSTIILHLKTPVQVSGLLGTTGYADPASFRSLAAAYQFNPQSVLSEAARLVTQAQQLAGDGLDGYLATVQTS